MNKEERARRADEREYEGSAGHLPPSDLPHTPSPEQPKHEEAPGIPFDFARAVMSEEARRLTEREQELREQGHAMPRSQAFLEYVQTRNKIERTDESWDDRLAELYDIEDEGRMLEYVRRSPEAAAADLSSLLALLSKAEQERDEALQTSVTLARWQTDAEREHERLRNHLQERALAAERELERLREAATVRPKGEQSVGHWWNGTAHWYDPFSSPMPGCPLCAALSADTQREDG